MNEHSPLPIIDVDSHVVEPRDLWTSRLPGRPVEQLPHVIFDERGGEPRWRIGSKLLSAECEYATAGWTEPFPAHPPTLEEADPAVHDPVARLRKLDEQGIQAQVLYPNIIGFDSHAFLTEGLSTDCVRAYNDFLTEFASVAPDRFVPIAMLPYWDLDASIAEMQRVRDLGHRGILMGALLKRLGMPNLSDPHWHPLLASAQDLGMSVNLHVGFNLREADAVEEDYDKRTRNALEEHTNRLAFVKLMASSNASVIAGAVDLILRGTCERFPDLTFVSVESGFGYWPFVLDSLDWHWHTSAAVHEHADRMLPSEYWYRNFMATFWFERRSILLLEDFQDNVMFETDFPHETGVFSGPWSHNATALETVRRNILGVIDDGAARKVLWENAARLYDIPLPVRE